MKTTLIYTALDLLFAIGVAIVAIWSVSSLIPTVWGPVLGMAAGMIGGMAIGHILGFIFSIPLGMFESMYLGSFSGMWGGMAGAMMATEKGDTILCGVGVGAGVWLVLSVMNLVYQKRSSSHA